MKEKVKFSKKILLILLSIIMVFVGICISFTIGKSTLNAEEATQSFNPDFFLVEKGSVDEDKTSWTFTNSTITGTATGESSTCSSDDKESEICLRYIGSNPATIKFNYSVNLNEGTVRIDGASMTANGSFEKQINQDQTIFFYVKSKKGAGTTTLSITDFSFTFDKEITIVFKKPINGTYTLNGVSITEDYTFVTNANEEFSLTASENPGYKFVCWIFNDQTISTNKSLTTTYYDDCNAYPLFVAEEKAIFAIGNKYFDDLNEAIIFAQNNSNKTIILKESGSVESGKIYTFTSGIILAIPDSDVVKIYEPNSTDFITYYTGADKKQEPFRTLTIPTGTNLVFESGSRLFVASKARSAGGGNPSCLPYGKYGFIKLEDSSSKITLNQGSILQCYGYISGEGAVIDNSGSPIYELFQIYNWRGGSATSSITGLLNKRKKVFPINQYYVQNIESNFVIFYGANVKTHSAVYSASSTHTITIDFIGENGIFKINSGYIARRYDYETDRIIYNIEGSAELNSITISLAGASISSKDYVLPINNFVINISSGSSIKIMQDVALLPNCVLNINYGGELRFLEGSSLFVYDNFARYGKKFATALKDSVTIIYSATLDSIDSEEDGSPDRTSTIDTPDAEIIIDGKVYLSDSYIYTTVSDNNGIIEAANIHSNGTGEIYYYSDLGTGSLTYQVQQSDTKVSFVEIPIQNSYLKNGENASTSYFVPGDVDGGLRDKKVCYNAESDEWYVSDEADDTSIITFINSENSNETKDLTYTAGSEFTFPKTGSELGFTLNDNNLNYWEIENVGIFKPGETVALPALGDIVAKSVYGGWVDLSSSDRGYVDYETGDLLTGLKRVNTFDGSGTIICLFNDAGKFESTKNGVYFNSEDNSSYYLEMGIAVEEQGLRALIKDITVNQYYDYIYISNGAKLLTNDRYYIETSQDDVLPSGYYNFDENGYIIREDDDTAMYNQTLYVKNDVTYIYGIRVAYGLFDQNNYLYYSDSNGNLVKNKTFYVIDTKDYSSEKVKVGLYYFDSEGRMCDEKLNPIEVSNL